MLNRNKLFIFVENFFMDYNGLGVLWKKPKKETQNTKYKIKKHLDQSNNVVFGVAVFCPMLLFSRDVSGKIILFRKSGYYFDYPNFCGFTTQVEADKLIKDLIECDNFEK